MRVIKTHMIDGDVVQRVELDLTPDELEAAQAESEVQGVTVSFSVLDEGLEEKNTEKPAVAKLIEAVAKKTGRATSSKKK